MDSAPMAHIWTQANHGLLLGCSHHQEEAAWVPASAPVMTRTAVLQGMRAESRLASMGKVLRV